MKKIVGDCSTKIILTKEESASICRLGQGKKCCAFLTCSAEGLMCSRMVPEISGAILRRLDKGMMNAKGRGQWGNCPWCAE